MTRKKGGRKMSPTSIFEFAARKKSKELHHRELQKPLKKLSPEKMRSSMEFRNKSRDRD